MVYFLVPIQSVPSWPVLQISTPVLPPWAADQGHNELYRPTPNHIFPMKKPLEFDEKQHYYEHHHNNEKNGTYKRASCPALNTLANRGFIPRTGRDVTYQNMAQSMRDVFNFGDDNIMLVLVPAFALHPGATTLDLDHFMDQNVQHAINCPAAPTRLDKDVGNNIDINMTLFNQLLSFSKDGVTFSLEDLAEHHHLRHNQSRAENPHWQFGNSDATCALAQYTNLIGVLGRNGRYGLQTLYVEDVKRFYLQDDLPIAYERRELPYYAVEATGLNDRMTHHIGYQITRPFPPWDHNGTDVEPLIARYEKVSDAVGLASDTS